MGELLVRWFQFSIFTAVVRLHGSRDPKEPQVRLHALLCSIVFYSVFFHSTLKDMPEFDMRRAYAIHKGTGGAREIVDVNCSWSCWELGGK